MKRDKVICATQTFAAKAEKKTDLFEFFDVSVNVSVAKRSPHRDLRLVNAEDDSDEEAQDADGQAEVNAQQEDCYEGYDPNDLRKEMP